ncbi:hypothetical protein ACFV1W_25285 [Kitasatospora sp. NPDC059648]|uniref:hypothetical protein n=1 Tax=Kitasatospora sp. NPDC059648 TaxID=3346894 RepID=UPI0036881BA8
MPQIRVITLDNGRIALVSPYDPDVPAAARKIGGRWDSTAKYWHFDGRDEERVRELALEIFGTDGTPEAEADTVTIRWDISGANTEELRYSGRLVARRRSRDERPQLGQGVILISGGFPARGGSEKYPKLDAKAGTVVEIRDLPRAAVDADDPDVTIVDERVDVEALQAERERIVARLAEIDAVLAAHGAPAP